MKDFSLIIEAWERKIKFHSFHHSMIKKGKTKIMILNNQDLIISSLNFLPKLWLKLLTNHKNKNAINSKIDHNPLMPTEDPPYKM